MPFTEVEQPQTPAGETHPVDDDRISLVQRLFIKHQPLVRAAVLALLPNLDLADDVVQETFVTATKKAGDFTPGTSYPAWICTIARFKAREALRRGPLVFQALSDEVLEKLCDEQSPALSLDRQQRMFDDCIRRLAPRARQAIELRYRNAALPGDIAARMGWTPGAVKVALSRARLVLRDCVARKIAMEQG